MESHCVSVIIPVYNSEKFIKRCVDSVLSQNFKNIEIIIVNDGSSDNSASLIDSYANKYNNIKAFHSINTGASEARKKGFNNATGDYIFYLDSDDELSNDAINYLYDKCITNNLDIAYGAANRVVNNKIIVKISHPKEGIFFGNDYLTYILDLNCICGLWGLSKRAIWKNDVFSPKGELLPGEDVYINIKLSKYVSKFGLYNKVVYHYHYNSNSLSISGTHFNINAWSKNFNYIRNELKSRDLLEEMEQQLRIIEIDRITFNLKNIDINHPWIQQVLSYNTKKLPIKTRFFKELVRFPKLKNKLLFVKRTIIGSKK